MVSALKKPANDAADPQKTAEDCVRETKDMRDSLTEEQIDKALEDTFPASDPPAWY